MCISIYHFQNRVLKLENGLTALLISDTLKKGKRNTTPDQQVNGIIDNEENSNEADSDSASETDGDSDGDSVSDDDDDSDDGDDVGENGGDVHGDKTRDEDLKLSKNKTIQRETKLVSTGILICSILYPDAPYFIIYSVNSRHFYLSLEEHWLSMG